METLNDYKVCLKSGETEVWVEVQCESKEAILTCLQCEGLIEAGFKVEHVIHLEDND